MGALEGSLSFSTYYVQGEPPNDFQDNYLRKLQEHFFEPLSPMGDEERSVGWVPVQDPIATEFTRDNVFFNAYILFAMRIDKWSLPTPWVKAYMRKAIAERMPALDKEEEIKQLEAGKMRPRAKLSKREKDKIKLEVTTEIKQHILPAMKIIDICWNFQEQKLRIWSQSSTVCDEFAELFEATFGLKLDQDSPYMMAANLGLSQAQLDNMCQIDPWHPVFDSEE